MMHAPSHAFTQAADLALLRREARRSSSVWLSVLAWITAAAVTLGLHIALYLLLTREKAPPAVAQEMPAAVMVNLAPIAVTARSEVDNTTPGPPADASEQAQQKPVEEVLPPPVPKPVVDVPPPPPDVKPQAVLPPKPPEQKKIDQPVEQEKVKTPVEKKKPIQKKVVEKKPVDTKLKRRAASRNAGGPRSDRQTADTTAASAAGAFVSEVSRASWQNEVRAQIVRAKHFPSDARGQTGVAVVSVTIGAGGGASGVRLVASSGNAAFDGEAVAVMYRAAPYPQPPSGRTTMLTVPLNFRR